jgi:hypothetical protein|mmetsp:Transcript_96222/g.257255  ORF Transcript_96222/g.257255 Transcript_96222/m.257255 type:complete len:95 (-) Transcript_96222:268-552(-)
MGRVTEAVGVAVEEAASAGMESWGVNITDRAMKAPTVYETACFAEMARGCSIGIPRADDSPSSYGLIESAVRNVVGTGEHNDSGNAFLTGVFVT